MKSPNLLDRSRAQLLVVDLQEKFAPVIAEMDAILRRSCFMIELADLLELPITLTEQYPAGLGRTVAKIAEHLPRTEPIEKLTFSCWRTPAVQERLVKLDRRQIIIVGIETAVCILQSSLDLLAGGFEVYICADAVGARYALDNEKALTRIAGHGGTIGTTETAAFELLDLAGTDTFKSALKLIKKHSAISYQQSAAEAEAPLRSVRS